MRPSRSRNFGKSAKQRRQGGVATADPREIGITIPVVHPERQPEPGRNVKGHSKIGHVVEVRGPGLMVSALSRSEPSKRRLLASIGRGLV